MTNRELYKDTFDEINISEHMMAKLLLIKNVDAECKKKYGVLYQIVKVIVAFGSVFAASGALFSVPLL